MRKSKDGYYYFQLPMYNQWYAVKFELTTGSLGMCENQHDGPIVMKFKCKTQNTIAHECVHAGMFTLANINSGVGTDVESHEHFAYLVGWLVEQVNKALEKENAIEV